MTARRKKQNTMKTPIKNSNSKFQRCVRRPSDLGSDFKRCSVFCGLDSDKLAFLIVRSFHLHRHPVGLKSCTRIHYFLSMGSTAWGNFIFRFNLKHEDFFRMDAPRSPNGNFPSLPSLTRKYFSHSPMFARFDDGPEGPNPGTPQCG